MLNLAINRLGLVKIESGKGLEPMQMAVVLSELASLGYRLTNPELLDKVSASFLSNYHEMVKELKRKRGANVNYVPLFKSFPESIPDDRIYMYRRLLGYLDFFFWDIYDWKDTIKFHNGVEVPIWLFDASHFGANPVTQMQSQELFELAIREEEMKLNDNHTEWLDLTLAFPQDFDWALRTYLESIVYSKSSIKEELHQEVFSLLDYLGADFLDGKRIVFKETRALLLAHLWKNKAYQGIESIATSATDLLRMFAAITETDVSLATPIKFPKMNRKARKAILAVMEYSFTLAEDLRNYKDLWLEIGRYLHPGEYAGKFPRVAKMFDALRNGKIRTFNSKTESLILQMELEALMEHLEKRPGVYARKLHELLRTFAWASDLILDSFASVADKLQIKHALVLKRYFNSINRMQDRTIINKQGKIVVLPNEVRETLTPDCVAQISQILDKAIMGMLSEKESWEGKTYWIDPRLRNFTVPLQQRKASDGVITVGRGSRIDVDFDKVLRLFIYWREKSVRTDLDLSVMQMDANFKYIGHVSYTNLKSMGIVHSGDIQSAPKGAAEFIDITLKMIPANVRYLAVQIYRYAGHTFQEMDCHAGWMVRQKTGRKVKRFDAKTVANKFDLNGSGAYAIPLIVDLKRSQIIMTDLYVSGREIRNRVEGSSGNVGLICSQVAQFIQTRPTMEDLAWYNAMARKAVFVDEKADADITFGYKDCTYNATDVERVLSELI